MAFINSFVLMLGGMRHPRLAFPPVSPQLLDEGRPHLKQFDFVHVSMFSVAEGLWVHLLALVHNMPVGSIPGLGFLHEGRELVVGFAKVPESSAVFFFFFFV